MSQNPNRNVPNGFPHIQTTFPNNNIPNINNNNNPNNNNNTNYNDGNGIPPSPTLVETDYDFISEHLQERILLDDNTKLHTRAFIFQALYIMGYTQTAAAFEKEIFCFNKKRLIKFMQNGQFEEALNYTDHFKSILRDGEYSDVLRHIYYSYISHSLITNHQQKTVFLIQDMKKRGLWDDEAKEKYGDLLTNSNLVDLVTKESITTRASKAIEKDLCNVSDAFSQYDLFDGNCNDIPEVYRNINEEAMLQTINVISTLPNNNNRLINNDSESFILQFLETTPLGKRNEREKEKENTTKKKKLKDDVIGESSNNNTSSSNITTTPSKPMDTTNTTNINKSITNKNREEKKKIDDEEEEKKKKEEDRKRRVEETKSSALKSMTAKSTNNVPPSNSETSTTPSTPSKPVQQTNSTNVIPPTITQQTTTIQTTTVKQTTIQATGQPSQSTQPSTTVQQQPPQAIQHQQKSITTNTTTTPKTTNEVSKSISKNATPSKSTTTTVSTPKVVAPSSNTTNSNNTTTTNASTTPKVVPPASNTTNTTTKTVPPSPNTTTTTNTTTVSTPKVVPPSPNTINTTTMTPSPTTKKPTNTTTTNPSPISTNRSSPVTSPTIKIPAGTTTPPLRTSPNLETQNKVTTTLREVIPIPSLRSSGVKFTNRTRAFNLGVAKMVYGKDNAIVVVISEIENEVPAINIMLCKTNSESEALKQRENPFKLQNKIYMDSDVHNTIKVKRERLLPYINFTSNNTYLLVGNECEAILVLKNAKKKIAKVHVPEAPVPVTCMLFAGDDNNKPLISTNAGKIGLLEISTQNLEKEVEIRKAAPITKMLPAGDNKFYILFGDGQVYKIHINCSTGIVNYDEKKTLKFSQTSPPGNNDMWVNPCNDNELLVKQSKELLVLTTSTNMVTKAKLQSNDLIYACYSADGKFIFVSNKTGEILIFDTDLKSKGNLCNVCTLLLLTDIYVTFMHCYFSQNVQLLHIGLNNGEIMYLPLQQQQ
ncbi:hypothetical protein ABK040_012678 [Willaertia magna]